MDLQGRGLAPVRERVAEGQLRIGAQRAKSAEWVGQNRPIHAGAGLDCLEHQCRRAGAKHHRPVTQIRVTDQQVQAAARAESAPRAEEYVAALVEGAILARGEDTGQAAHERGTLGEPEGRPAVEHHAAGARIERTRHQEGGQIPVEAPKVEAVVHPGVEGDQWAQRQLDPGQSAGRLPGAGLK